MRTDELHPLVEDYLRQLRQAGRHLPPDRLRELSAEIEAHLAEAVGPGPSEADVREALERLGPPDEIVEAEQPFAQGPIDRRGAHEWGAVILLPLGGFVFGVGWLVGLFLLWSSRLWTIRDKLIGTLIAPGGIATTLVVILLTGTKRRCTTVTPNAPIGHPATHCTPGGGAGTTVLQIVLIAFFVLGPIVSAVYLARRARNRPALTAV